MNNVGRSIPSHEAKLLTLDENVHTRKLVLDKKNRSRTIPLKDMFDFGFPA